MSLFQVDPERIRRTTGTLWVRVDKDPLKERGDDKQYASLTKLPFWQSWKQYFVLLKTEEEPAELRWFVDRNETAPTGVIVLDQIARGADRGAEKGDYKVQGATPKSLKRASESKEVPRDPARGEPNVCEITARIKPPADQGWGDVTVNVQLAAATASELEQWEKTLTEARARARASRRGGGRGSYLAPRARRASLTGNRARALGTHGQPAEDASGEQRGEAARAGEQGRPGRAPKLVAVQGDVGSRRRRGAVLCGLRPRAAQRDRWREGDVHDPDE